MKNSLCLEIPSDGGGPPVSSRGHPVVAGRRAVGALLEMPAGRVQVTWKGKE